MRGEAHCILVRVDQEVSKDEVPLSLARAQKRVQVVGHCLESVELPERDETVVCVAVAHSVGRDEVVAHIGWQEHAVATLERRDPRR